MLRDRLRPALRSRRETLATLKEAILLPLDLAPVIPRALAGEDVVVLVHGFLATAGVFRPMRARLERELGVHVASFTHAPGMTVRRIAAQLGSVVDRIPNHARVHLVGHSLGGVVARWYVQELGGHARVTQTISLASPFHGTHAAKRFPWLVGAELLEGSLILERLRARAHHHNVRHTSIVAGEDRLVVPSASATLAWGETVVLHGRGHNELLFDEEVLVHLKDRLRPATWAAA